MFNRSSLPRNSLPLGLENTPFKSSCKTQIPQESKNCQYETKMISKAKTCVDRVGSKKCTKNPSNPRLLQEYIGMLQTQLSEEQEQNEALNLERAKLKVCWEMALEELSATRSELSEKIVILENKLHKQVKRQKTLQKLLRDYEVNLKEMKGLLENIIERPKCNIKY